MRLHEYAWGAEDAPEVVCVHGVTGHALRFRRLAERLAARRRVRAVDLRGHGRSGYEEPWTIAAHVGDLAETAGAPADWIGHSFGGRLVVELAAREPALVRRAVLLDPALWAPPDYAAARAAEQLAGFTYASPEEAVEARATAAGLGFLAHAPREGLEEEVAQHLVEAPDGRFRYRYSDEAIAAAWHEMATLPPSFDRVRVPTLLVLGRLSKLVSGSELEDYRAALGDLLQVVVVPGGHIPLWDAFEETAAALERFLDAG
jgi:lipase